MFGDTKVKQEGIERELSVIPELEETLQLYWLANEVIIEQVSKSINMHKKYDYLIHIKINGLWLKPLKCDFKSSETTTVISSTKSGNQNNIELTEADCYIEETTDYFIYYDKKLIYYLFATYNPVTHTSNSRDGSRFIRFWAELVEKYNDDILPSQLFKIPKL